MVMQKDIAAACGLSVAAVSKALRDRADISEETKRRVREMAVKMGYRLDVMEKRRRRTYLIGIVVTREAECAFHREIIVEIRKALMANGFDVVMLSPESLGREAEGRARDGDEVFRAHSPAPAEIGTKALLERPGYLARARKMGVEGIFLFCQAREVDLYRKNEPAGVRGLLEGEIPVLSIDCLFEACSGIVPEYARGIGELVRYACHKGHRRMALIYGAEDACGAACEKGFYGSMRDLRLEVAQKYVQCARREDVQGGYEAVRDILGNARWIRPTCFFFTDEWLLQGGMAAIHGAMAGVPGQISVAVLRRSPSAGVFSGHVTGWEFSPAEIAREAVARMLYELAFLRPRPLLRQMVPGRLDEGETLREIRI